MSAKLQLSIEDVSSYPEAPIVWQRIIDVSEDGWLWHSWSTREFNLCAAEQFEVRDLSFFVCEDGEPVGVVPLVLQRNKAGDLVVQYYSGFLPSPAFLNAATRDRLEDLALEELERRAKDAGVVRAKLWYATPTHHDDQEERTARIAEKFGYVRSDIRSHMVAINEGTLSNVRDRYRRYHKKFASEFDLSIVEREGVTREIEEAYMKLHIKNTKQVRSRASYTKQSDIARAGEAFYVVAKDRKTEEIVGMLLVSCYKNAAFDNSVAIDPAFADKYVGHLLKWRAIEELQKRNVPSYTLGPVAGEAASEKEKGISNFKDGWARGNTRTIWELRKEF